MGVDLLHPEPAITMGDPFAAYVNGEVTQVSRMTNVPVSSGRSHLGSVGVDLLHQAPAANVGVPFYWRAHVTGEVAKVSKMTDVHPKFLEN